MTSAADVKALRDKTGAGMADCKKALDESNGDMQAAIEWLRKRGAASASKRADREAKEGIVVASAIGSIVTLIGKENVCARTTVECVVTQTSGKNVGAVIAGNKIIVCGTGQVLDAAEGIPGRVTELESG